MTTVAFGPPAIVSTRVTGRRIVQYIVDVFIVGVLLSLLHLLVEAAAPGVELHRVSGDLTSIDVLVGRGGWGSVWAVLLTALVWLVVFVVVPAWRGRTLGMMVLGLRIVRRGDGGPASVGQHLGRALLLIVDSVGGGLFGWIVIICSAHRQRLGDHAAGTLVIADRPDRRRL